MAAAKNRLTPRGVRNHNPGNIRHSKDQWQGRAQNQVDKEFVTFASPVWGIRAIARILIRYQDAIKGADGSRIDTIAEVIDRWAPAVENNTRAYIKAVDAAHPKGAYDRLNLHDYDDVAPLVRAIINHENGNPKLWGKTEWYPQDVIDEGLARAGIVKRDNKTKTETKVATTVAVGAATSTGAGIYVATQVHETVQAMNQVGRAKIEAGDAQQGLVYLGGGLAILVAGAVALAYLAWRKSRIRKEEAVEV